MLLFVTLGLVVMLGVVVTGCSRTSDSSASLPALQTASESALNAAGTGYTSLYKFKDVPDGANPEAGLVAVHGKLYGDTFNGGEITNGIIFELSTSGAERVLYRFRGGFDGLNPYTKLTDVNGELYGDTAAGGGGPCHTQFYGYGCGTIFKISTSGAERVLYRFSGRADGSIPQAVLVALNGDLYGTAQLSGTCTLGPGCGTVFKVSKSGAFSIVHSFKGGGADGALPLAGMIVVNGKLYGTTSAGGANNAGTIFELSTSGKERIVYSFKGGTKDGGEPWSGLIDVGGKIGRASCRERV